MGGSPDVTAGASRSSPLRDSPTLVTGASGFLGTHVCRTFAAAGYPVRAMVRDAARVPVGVPAVVADDLLDRDGIRRALDGIGTVVHLAARVHVLGDRGADSEAAYQRTNVEGTRVLLEEAIRAGARRFVFVSSVKAVGESTETAWDADTLPAPADPYGRSKLEAERVVRAMAASAGIDAPILRLPLVYGPGMKANMLRLFQAVDRGWPLPFASIANRRSLLFSGNLVAAIEAAAAETNAGRETFFVSDGHDLSTAELVREIGAALGRPARLLAVPQPLFRAAARVGDRLQRIVPFPLTTAAFERLFGSLIVDSSRLREVTRFEPPFTIRDGLRATAAWYRSRTV